MNLYTHYSELYNDAVVKIRSNNYQLDPLIDSDTDRRRGLTFLIRPPEEVKLRMSQMLDELQQAEPEQYYYPSADRHVTVLSVISCYEGFRLDNVNSDEYIRVSREAIEGFGPFPISFRGITASPSCVMICGYFSEASLNCIREKLRKVIKQSGLQQSVDVRYRIQAAHSTVVRFRQPLRSAAHLLALLERYRNFDFGTFRVKAIELVCNDWYQRSAQVQKLAEVPLL